MEFQGYYRERSCVVTGAASGIGFAVSKALLRAGAVVSMADLNTELLASAVEGLGELARRVHPETVDVTRQEQVRKLVEGAAARHGRLDFLFNNAGVGATMPIEQANLEHWRKVIDINLWSVIYGIDAALPIMRRQGGGHIVSTASIAGLLPVPFQALYCATKYAVAGLSESLRFELQDAGVNFSVVCPGNVATPIFRGMAPPLDAISPEEAAQAILEGVAEKEGIIVFPEKYRQMWRQYWSDPQAFEAVLLDIAKQRRESYRSKGTYY